MRTVATGRVARWKSRDHTAVWIVSHASQVSASGLAAAKDVASKIFRSGTIHVRLLPVDAPSSRERFAEVWRRFAGRDGRAVDPEEYLIEVSEDNVDEISGSFPRLRKAPIETLGAGIEVLDAGVLAISPLDSCFKRVTGTSVASLPVRPPEETATAPVGRVLLPLVNPEESESFFRRALNYADSRGMELSLFLKSDFSVDLVGCDAVVIGSPFEAFREQKRISIVADWVSYAAELGMRVTIVTDRSGRTFHDAVLGRIREEIFDLVVVDGALMEDFFWRRAIRKLSRAAPVPVWSATADFLWRNEAVAEDWRRWTG